MFEVYSEQARDLLAEAAERGALKVCTDMRMDACLEIYGHV